VNELKIDMGPGYRIYYEQRGSRIIILCAGTKKTQSGTSGERKPSGKTARKQAAPLAPYKAKLLERLQNVDYCREYLTAALEEGDDRVFLLALRDVAEAHGISKVAKGAKLNRENLYRNLSASGNPKLSSLSVILHTLSLRLAVVA
jgi:probable addiction module antidote protein